MSREDEGAVPFERIGIAGTGLIGGSIALAAKQRWPEVHVTGTASRSGPLPEGMLDRTVADVAAMASTCDLIVLAVPVPIMPAMFETLVRLQTRAVVTDVGSIKRRVMSAADTAGLTSFVGGHPMAGGERPGAAEARADLFQGRPWPLVKGTAGADPSARLERFVRALGAVPFWMDAELHDRTVAYVSHLPQLVATALMNAADAAVRDTGPQVAGNAFAEMTRLASSPADLWRDICAENADFVAEALKAFLAELPPASSLDQGTWVERALTGSAEARRRWRAPQRSDRGQ